MLNTLNASAVNRMLRVPTRRRRFCSVMSTLKPLRIVHVFRDRRQPEERSQAVRLFRRQLARAVARVVEARTSHHTGARHAERFVQPVARGAVAVQIASFATHVERRFRAEVDDRAKLHAERQLGATRGLRCDAAGPDRLDQRSNQAATAPAIRSRS